MPIAGAQVKSALLFAALQATGTTTGGGAPAIAQSYRSNDSRFRRIDRGGWCEHFTHRRAVAGRPRGAYPGRYFLSGVFSSRRHWFRLRRDNSQRRLPASAAMFATTGSIFLPRRIAGPCRRFYRRLRAFALQSVSHGGVGHDYGARFRDGCDLTGACRRQDPQIGSAVAAAGSGSCIPPRRCTMAGAAVGSSRTPLNHCSRGLGAVHAAALPEPTSQVRFFDMMRVPRRTTFSPRSIVASMAVSLEVRDAVARSSRCRGFSLGPAKIGSHTQGAAGSEYCAMSCIAMCHRHWWSDQKRASPCRSAIGSARPLAGWASDLLSRPALAASGLLNPEFSSSKGLQSTSAGTTQTGPHGIVVCVDVPGVASTLEELTLSLFHCRGLFRLTLPRQISVVPENLIPDSASTGAGYLLHFLR